jgi:tRNA threonylcarbamoyladenosine biosynthesis protein TsaB
MHRIKPPMRILAVDTSTSSGSIALLEDARVMAERTLLTPLTHNRRLLEDIDHCLNELGWPFEQLEGFAVGIGPGSFTGLRIGVTSVKTLAWSVRKPLAAIPSLDALAAPFGFSALPVCPLIDARKQEVYFALYQPDGRGGVALVTPYLVDTPERVLARIKGPTIFCGDGWPLCRELFSRRLGEWALEAPAPLHVIRASIIGELARKRFQEQLTDDPVDCVPLYVRRSEAEIRHPQRAGLISS